MKLCHVGLLSHPLDLAPLRAVLKKQNVGSKVFRIGIRGHLQGYYVDIEVSKCKYPAFKCLSSRLLHNGFIIKQFYH